MWEVLVRGYYCLPVSTHSPIKPLEVLILDPFGPHICYVIAFDWMVFAFTLSSRAL